MESQPPRWLQEPRRAIDRLQGRHCGLLCRHSLDRWGGQCLCRLRIHARGRHASAGEQSSGIGWRRTRGRRKNGGGRGGRTAAGVGGRRGSWSAAGARDLRSRRRPRRSARRRRYSPDQFGFLGSGNVACTTAGSPVPRLIVSVIDGNGSMPMGCPREAAPGIDERDLSASRQREAEHSYCNFSSHD